MKNCESSDIRYFPPFFSMVKIPYVFIFFIAIRVENARFTT